MTQGAERDKAASRISSGKPDASAGGKFIKVFRKPAVDQTWEKVERRE
jgi:hypothetical protein